MSRRSADPTRHPSPATGSTTAPHSLHESASPSLPDLPRLAMAARPDLAASLALAPGADPTQDERFWLWFVRQGLREMPALGEDGPLRSRLRRSAEGGLSRLQQLAWLARPDVQAAHPLPQDLQGFLHWFRHHGVRELALWPLLDTDEQAELLASKGDDPVLQEQARAWARRQKTLTDDLEPPNFGVNVFGYAYGQLGIGEDARMAVRALQACGVPTCLVDFAPGKDIPQRDKSLKDHVADEPRFAFNLVCLTAAEHARMFLERGRAALRGRYNIGYWPWELSNWPRPWLASLSLVDEVWVSSEHTRQALRRAMRDHGLHRPIMRMPLAVDVGERSTHSRAHTRQRFGLPTKACLFVFSFDLNSSFHRKNPQAVVDAFLRAFPPGVALGCRVGLVIKTHRPRPAEAHWSQLKALAHADQRLHLIAQTLPRNELLSLYAACDCMVSLHRAEGYGRNIAEALQLGLHVVATRYSGNLDFCEAPELRERVDLVPVHMVPVAPGQYPYADGQAWAEPSIGHASWFLRAFAARHSRGLRHEPPPSQGWSRFSLAQVGERYARRLARLWRRGALEGAVFAGHG